MLLFQNSSMQQWDDYYIRIYCQRHRSVSNLFEFWI